MKGKYFLTLNPHATTGLLLEAKSDGPWRHHVVGLPIAMVEVDERDISGMDGEEIMDFLIHADWKTPDGEMSIKGIWMEGVDEYNLPEEKLVVQFTPDDEVLEKAILESGAFVVLKRRAQIKLAA